MKFSKNAEVFLKKPNFMVLSTKNPNGTIQMSVMWYRYVKGKFELSTTTTRAKYKNITRDSQVSFLIYDIENPYRYIEVRGKASITKKGAVPLINILGRRYTGKDFYPDGPPPGEVRVIINITPEKILQRGF